MKKIVLLLLVLLGFILGAQTAASKSPSEPALVIFKVAPKKENIETTLINTERYCKNSITELCNSYGLKSQIDEKTKTTSGALINCQVTYFRLYVIENGSTSVFSNKYCMDPVAVAKLNSVKKGTKVFFEQVEVKSPNGNKVKLKSRFRAIKQ